MGQRAVSLPYRPTLAVTRRHYKVLGVICALTPEARILLSSSCGWTDIAVGRDVAERSKAIYCQRSATYGYATEFNWILRLVISGVPNLAHHVRRSRPWASRFSPGSRGAKRRLGDLISRYKDSGSYRNLRRTTRSEYDRARCAGAGSPRTPPRKGNGAGPPSRQGLARRSQPVVATASGWKLRWQKDADLRRGRVGPRSCRTEGPVRNDAKTGSGA
jgi:hypothetical protein